MISVVVEQRMDDYKVDPECKMEGKEAEEYDEKIRQWMREGKERLERANILIVGVPDVAVQLGKKLAYHRVKRLTVLCGDESPDDFTKAVHGINSNVEIIVDYDEFTDKNDCYFAKFQAVCACNCTADELCQLNQICRKYYVPFFCGDAYGKFGYCFSDLDIYTYLRPDVQREKMCKPVRLKQSTKTVEFLPFSHVFYGHIKFVDIRGFLTMELAQKHYLLLHILLRFREEKGRFPESVTKRKDLIALKSYRQALILYMAADKYLVSDKDLRNCIDDSKSTISNIAFLLSQEITSAIRRDDRPAQNFMFYDDESKRMGELLVE